MAPQRIHPPGAAPADLPDRCSEAAVASGARCATDVTGFGLLGHLYKLARASGVSAVVDAAAVPYLEGAREALRDGYVSGGTRRTLDWVRPHVDFGATGEDEALLLADADLRWPAHRGRGARRAGGRRTRAARRSRAAGAVITARYAGGRRDEERAVGDQGKAKVLSIGLHPSTVDFTPYPGQDASTLMARIRAGAEALRANGFDPVLCLVPTDPDEAEAVVRGCLAEGPFRAVLVGAGVRTAPEHTVLFERLVNLAHEALPDARFCFNTSPETTLDAFRRAVG